MERPPAAAVLPPMLATKNAPVMPPRERRTPPGAEPTVMEVETSMTEIRKPEVVRPRALTSTLVMPKRPEISRVRPPATPRDRSMSAETEKKLRWAWALKSK